MVGTHQWLQSTPTHASGTWPLTATFTKSCSHTSLSASEHIVTLQFIPNESDLTQL